MAGTVDDFPQGRDRTRPAIRHASLGIVRCRSKKSLSP
jgi:hypothetical protein